MRSKEIPIAVPIRIPIINPISKLESGVSFDKSNCSLSEITNVELSVSVIFVEFSESTIIDFDGILFSELEIMSDERFVNFALRVIGSVVEFPPNKVECVKSQ